MDTEYRDLTTRLFAAATAMLEDAAAIAATGQSARLEPAALARHAAALRRAVQDIAVLAEAALIVAGLGPEGRPKPRKPRR